MGYGDVQALNPESRIPTPHLNRLAAQGITFTDAHTPSAVCTPTRYGLLTGRYAWRTRLKKGVLNGYGEPLIEPGRQTVASFLQRHGYHTGMVGKWHLGLGFAKTADGSFDFSKPVSDGPHTRGFQVFLHHSGITGLSTIHLHPGWCDRAIPPGNATSSEIPGVSTVRRAPVRPDHGERSRRSRVRGWPLHQAAGGSRPARSFSIWP